MNRKKILISAADKVRKEIGNKPNVELDYSQLTGSSRKRKVINGRYYIARILRDKGMTLTKIGILLGGKTHATIINLLKKGESRLLVNEQDEKIKTGIHKAMDMKGISRAWIYKQMHMDRETFWHKAIADSFTKDERQQINRLLK